MGCDGCTGCAGKKTIVRMEATENYDALYKFFDENGLEIAEDKEETIATDIVKAWALTLVGCSEGQLVGGIILAKRDGEYIIDGVAVEEKFRSGKVGSMLLNKALDVVKKLGGNALYLVAKAPGFFAKHGFVEVPKENAPEFFECLGCPQFEVNCFPKVMKLEIK